MKNIKALVMVLGFSLYSGFVLGSNLPYGDNSNFTPEEQKHAFLHLMGYAAGNSMYGHIIHRTKAAAISAEDLATLKLGRVSAGTTLTVQHFFGATGNKVLLPLHELAQEAVSGRATPVSKLQDSSEK